MMQGQAKQATPPRSIGRPGAVGRGRPGMTLPEILVVVGVLLVLVSLAMPAVQRAREAARRLRCAANLKQWVTALQLYTDAHAQYPPLSNGMPWLPGPGAPHSFDYSPHTRLLPHVGLGDVFNAINFSLDVWEPGYVPLYSWGGNWANATAYGARADVFVCPSDSGTRQFRTPCSYRGNGGLLEFTWPSFNSPHDGLGLFAAIRITKSQVTDGLDHTAAFAERLVGSAGRPNQPLRDVRRFLDMYLHEHHDLERYVEACRRLGTAPAEHVGTFPFSGSCWFYSSYYYTLYNHAAPPNWSTPDCEDGALRGVTGVFCARSAHPGGVNVAFASGRVRFVSAGVDLAVWRALSTRSGAEPISETSF